MIPEHVTVLITTLIVVGIPSVVAGGLALLWWRKARKLGRRPRPGAGTIVLLAIPLALGVLYAVLGFVRPGPDDIAIGLSLSATFILPFGTGGLAGWLFASSRKAEPTGCGASLFTGLGMLPQLLPLFLVAMALPSILPSKVSFGERYAVSALRKYHVAQEEFREADRYGIGRKAYANPKDGAGFPDLYELGGPDSGGEVLKLVDIMFASSRTGSEEWNEGYVFADITADASGPYDYAKQHGLCAVPAEYPRSGRLTFVTDASGSIYSRDTGGKAVTSWPDLEKEGWLIAGE